MNCVICKTGQMKEGTTTVTLDRDGVTVVFRSVPAKVCDTCGEAFVDQVVTDQLLSRADRAVRDGTQIQVVQYAA